MSHILLPALAETGSNRQRHLVNTRENRVLQEKESRWGETGGKSRTNIHAVLWLDAELQLSAGPSHKRSGPF